MKVSRQTLLAMGALSGALTTVGCSDGEDGSSCTVNENASGSATITCEDGSEVTVDSSPATAGGQDGSDGMAGVAGADGSPGAAGEDGADGAQGPAGQDGADGVAGTNCSVTDNGNGTVTITCGDGSEVTIGDEVVVPEPDPDYRLMSQTAADQVDLADGLSAEYLTREAGHKADMFSFWPSEASPTHLVFCIEGGREDLGAGKFNPSVQTIALSDGEVKTVLRGMSRCDGIRTTPWGSVLATEETVDGSAYEILNPLDGVEYTIADRGDAGGDANIVDGAGADAAAAVAKRFNLPVMAWEGLTVLESGVVIGGDELRPGSYDRERDGTPGTDGGALFKFIPATLRTDAADITALSQSPLTAGSSYAMRVLCNSDQYGQGCEIGEGEWVAIDAANAREDADIKGATGYYRPEDLHMDPDYTGAGVRFCVANTGNRGARNWGEVLCGVDPEPTSADSTPVINRFIEGDSELNAPDNLAFQPGTGILYVIEDNSNGDIWACLPDGDDRDIKSDGCVRMLSVRDESAEPTGFEFSADGTVAYVSIQHTRDNQMPQVDDYSTDDILVITGFGSPDLDAIASFSTDTAQGLADDAPSLFGFSAPAAASTADQSRLDTITDGAGSDTPAEGDTAFGEDASMLLELAEGLTATFLTRTAAHHMDMGGWWPHGSANPTHAIFCIESGREDLGGGKFNPSVQTIDLADGTVKTILRGMARCDGARVTPWGTVVATEETTDGSIYEILNPFDGEEYTITDRGGPGEVATVVDSGSNDASDDVVKRTELPTMAWEGLLVHDSGVVIGGDELRPGSYEDGFGSVDTDGGAMFKFIPSTLATPGVTITDLDNSPLTGGTTYALQISCRDSRQQFGQGCEIGNGAWQIVAQDDAREDANRIGATGYYRPEDLHLDPNYAGVGMRFCWANTGNTSVQNHGEIICAVDSDPTGADANERTVVANRLVEGDGDFAAPDNLDFQPVSGNTYVIEDRGNGDIWACLPDGSDRDIKTDGCVRLLALHDRGAEPTGFLFTPDGRSAMFIIQHSRDNDATTMLDDYDTDDVLWITGFADPATLDTNYGASVAGNLAASSVSLFGFGAPLTQSAQQ